MRRAVLFASLVVLAGAAAVEARQDVKQPPPKNGDPIVVKGCLNGPTLESAEAGAVDGDSLLPADLTFQLRGKKDILKDLVAKHDGQMVEITGVLKSNIQGSGPRGRKVGNTRIVIGVQSTTRDRAAAPSPQELLPVLDVKSFESKGLNCRR
jgi:hypothetical protein